MSIAGHAQNRVVARRARERRRRAATRTSSTSTGPAGDDRVAAAGARRALRARARERRSSAIVRRRRRRLRVRAGDAAAADRAARARPARARAPASAVASSPSSRSSATRWPALPRARATPRRGGAATATRPCCARGSPSCAAIRACAAAIDAELAAINADPVELDALLEAQAYRLAHWSVVGAASSSYRRFFDITSLVGLRIEDPDVFEATPRAHPRLARGRHDRGRARRSRRRAARSGGVPRAAARARAGGVDRRREDPRRATSGCRRLAGRRHDRLRLRRAASARCSSIPTGEARADRARSRSYTGEAWDPARRAARARREVMRDALHSELARLVELACARVRASPACRDYTRAEIEHALVELLRGLPGRTARTPTSARRATSIASGSRRRRRARDRQSIATCSASSSSALASSSRPPEARELATVAQQVTGAIVAKGDEDTLAYRQVRLAARCEVGCRARPVRARRRRRCTRARDRRRRAALLATATHDTKRGEDVRARLAALSEVARAWQRRDRALARARRRGWGDVPPDRVLEYLLWQTLVGAWPLDARARARVRATRRRARRGCARRGARPTRPTSARSPRGAPACSRDRELVAELAQLVAALAPRARRELARAARDQARGARRARLLPGQRARRLLASSIPTTGGRSTSARAAPRSPRSVTRACPRSRATSASRSCG